MITRGFASAAAGRVRDARDTGSRQGQRERAVAGEAPRTALDDATN